MKKFRFSLDSVLRVKKQREEVLKKELGALQAQRASAQRGLSVLLQQREEVLAWQKKARVNRVSTVAEETWFQRGHEGLEGVIASKRREVLDLEAACESRRLALVEASRERKVFEKLEENQKKDYLVELNREE